MKQNKRKYERPHMKTIHLKSHKHLLLASQTQDRSAPLYTDETDEQW